MPVGRPEPVVPVKVVWAFSIDRPTQACLFAKSLTMRICGCRAKAKPTTYWASMAGGGVSLRGVMPLEFSVSSDQFWPARTCSP